MLLIDCKAELKLKWVKHCVLDAAGFENLDANSIILFYCQRHKIICSCCHFISKRQSKTIKTP